MYISIQQLSVTHLYKSHDSGLNLQVLQQTVSVLFFLLFLTFKIHLAFLK